MDFIRYYRIYEKKECILKNIFHKFDKISIFMKLISLARATSHPETRHQGVMSRSPRTFVGAMATLRYEPCTQFINVLQRALHIYWQFSAMSHAIHKIASKKRCQFYFISRRSPHHGKSKNRDL